MDDHVARVGAILDRIRALSRAAPDVIVRRSAPPSKTFVASMCGPLEEKVWDHRCHEGVIGAHGAACLVLGHAYGGSVIEGYVYEHIVLAPSGTLVRWLEHDLAPGVVLDETLELRGPESACLAARLETEP